MCEADTQPAFLLDSFNSSTKPTNIELTNNNHTIKSTNSTWKTIRGTTIMKTGKFSFRFKIDEVPSSTTATMIGVCKPGVKSICYENQDGWVFYGYNGNKYHHNVDTSYGAKWKKGDVVGMFVDMDKKTLRFELNGKDYGVAYTNISNELVLAVDMYYSGEQITIF
ncbi:spry domain-containing socs box protein [Anaeramoeba flamelloides]|uniref:Spry domain-containing socs box protein n=1 Tax=Anaeramoeba flamelloides TaxID=1746091 RepID=A0AAV8A0K1_9EUKA|nr:spry domain-containing socs box protein [Anaeramoeba flamelloides]KAJ6237725.1 spry domain-containing socs box protein [Anaeramoeba flamelloides]|eukprot:Anaeramoba_flamelloidesc32869_g2_i1.p1 GENE.c32869_g2_i1~~c32869_g2_i1.p1  ORF type:complete len:166 (-),score=22.40 c32869_g2_i1:216-713(-)